MRLRNAEVLARCDESGELVAREGRVEVRYKPADGRAYFASASNLKPSGAASQIEPDSFCAPGEAAQKSKKATKKPSNAASSKESAAPEKPDGDEVLVYADGACSGNPGPAGVGAVALWADQRRELSEYIGEATNNIAELTGILRAAELATELGRPLRLYTDSTYSIGVLTKGWKVRANKELVAKVRQVLDAHPDAELFHVRGHQGVRLNEEADGLALRAVQDKASTGWVSP
jgi:ribonuclease HI